MDEILSVNHTKIDVSKLIEILQATTEFEEDLRAKFEYNRELQDDQRVVNFGDDGKVNVESGSAKEIAARYKQQEN